MGVFFLTGVFALTVAIWLGLYGGGIEGQVIMVIVLYVLAILLLGGLFGVPLLMLYRLWGWLKETSQTNKRVPPHRPFLALRFLLPPFLLPFSFSTFSFSSFSLTLFSFFAPSPSPFLLFSSP